MKDSANHNKTKVFWTIFSKSLCRKMAIAVFCLSVILGVERQALANDYYVTNNGDTGADSLRGAIEAANANAGADRILFNLSLANLTISPATPLPVITDTVTIDGRPGGNPANGPIVELSGAMTASSAGVTTNDQFGLQIAASAPGSTIRGLIINRFGNAGIKTAANSTTILQNIIGTNFDGAQGLGNVNQGILIVGSTGNVIGGTNNLDNSLPRNIISGNQGAGIAITRGGAATIVNNYIGIDRNGTADLGNTFDGILIAESSNSIIGGITAAERNVISGNNGNGVYIAQNAVAIPASGNVVKGNYIGVNSAGIGDGTTGNSTVGNDGSGVVIEASGNTVGGNTTGARNIISGNRSNGVSLSTNFATANKVSANYIGVASDTTVVRNRLNGVQISNLASNNKVGGTDTGVGVCDNSCNVIANNGDATVANALSARAGIYLDSSAGTGNSFQRNSIFSNTELGIDLAVPSSSNDTAFIPGTGTTPNDPGDPDTGANNLQNFPTINAANTNGDITGTLNSTSNTTFAIDFYSNTAVDAANSEGRTFIGSTTVITDGSGNAPFNFGTTAMLTAGQFITATATSTGGAAQAIGDTSEFSANQGVVTAMGGGAAGFEADTSSRMNGDGNILPDDVVQIRRFLNGTNTPSTVPNEFQRADSAPIGTRGDGSIDPTDVVQTRRYQNGTDAKQPAGGPVGGGQLRGAPQTETEGFNKTGAESDSPVGNPREVRVENASGSAGTTVTVNIRVNAVGNEAEYGFILNYDSGVLSNPVVGAGNAGASVRSCNIATAGQVNCSVGGFPNNNPMSSDPGIGEIAALNNQILITVTFTIAANAQPGTTPLTLTNVSASSDAPQLFFPTATNGMVTILAPTAAPASVSGRLTGIYGRGIANASVALFNTQSGQTIYVTTDSDGVYRFAGVSVGEDYIVTPVVLGYTFNPSNKFFSLTGDLSDLDFSAARSRSRGLRKN